LALISSALGDYQREIVVLFVRAEPLNVINNRLDQTL
jgi:hypothetical protein